MCNKVSKSIKYYIITLLFLFFPIVEGSMGYGAKFQMTMGTVLDNTGSVGLAITALILTIVFFLVELAVNYLPGVKDNEELAKIKPLLGCAAIIPAIFQIICVFVAWSKMTGWGLSFSGVIYIVILFAWVGSIVLSLLKSLGLQLPSVSDLFNNNK